MLGSAGGEAEATSDDPFRRRRNRWSTNTVKPIQTKAAPKIRITAGIVSMTEFRPGTVRMPYALPGVPTTWSPGITSGEYLLPRSWSVKGPCSSFDLRRTLSGILRPGGRLLGKRERANARDDTEGRVGTT